MSIYANGETVTKERIQEEPWYADYQSMMEFAVRDDITDEAELLKVFLADFDEVFKRVPTPEQQEQFKRWASEVAATQKKFHEGDTNEIG